MTETSLTLQEAAELNEAMFTWLGAQLDAFSFKANPAPTLTVDYGPEIRTYTKLYRASLERLHDIKALDDARLAEFDAKLPQI